MHCYGMNGSVTVGCRYVLMATNSVIIFFLFPKIFLTGPDRVSRQKRSTFLLLFLEGPLSDSLRQTLLFSYWSTETECRVSIFLYKGRKLELLSYWLNFVAIAVEGMAIPRGD